MPCWWRSLVGPRSCPARSSTARVGSNPGRLPRGAKGTTFGVHGSLGPSSRSHLVFLSLEGIFWLCSKKPRVFRILKETPLPSPLPALELGYKQWKQLMASEVPYQPNAQAWPEAAPVSALLPLCPQGLPSTRTPSGLPVMPFARTSNQMNDEQFLELRTRTTS